MKEIKDITIKIVSYLIAMIFLSCFVVGGIKLLPWLIEL